MNRNDINRDIEITPEAGPWTIFVQAYSGEEAPIMARKFVACLRGTYKLNAYVFNFGAKEKKDEYDRVQRIRQEQIDALRKAELPTDVPFRVSVVRIEEQTGVLIGGYRSFEEASTALKNQIRKLDAEGLKGKVDLDVWVVSSANDQDRTRATKIDLDGLGYINPFKRAFPARNPALPKEQTAAVTDDEMKLFRKVNEGEEFSLLQCKKPFTLAIKQFNMQSKTMNTKKEVAGFLDKFNNLGKLFQQGRWEDGAAHNAHNLAAALRKAGYPESYVLHCKHCSFVTIGGYNSEEDPQLVAMQNYLETLFKTDGYQRLEVFPRPVPMLVPGVGQPRAMQ